MIVANNDKGKTIFNAIAQGDEAAFEALFVEYRAKLYAIALKWTKSAYAAEEIIQDTFIALWTSRSQLADVHDPQAYLYTILVNKISRYLKKENNRLRILQMAVWSKSSYNETEELIYAKECSNIFERAIMQLPPQKKKIYKLSRVEGKSYDEIAADMHLSRNTVKSHLFEATKIIRDYMKEHAFLFFWLIAVWLK